MKVQLLKMMRDKILEIDYSIVDGYEGRLIRVKFITMDNTIDTFDLNIGTSRADTPFIHSYQLLKLIKYMFGTEFTDKLIVKHRSVLNKRETRKAKKLKELKDSGKCKIIYRF